MTVSGDHTKGKVLIVEEVDDNKRIDVFVASHMPDHVSRNRVQIILKKGGVLVNEAPVTSPKHKVKTGDTIAIDVPEPEEATPVAQDIPLDIYHEDDHLLVINKPAGMVVHPATGHPIDTLVNALLYHCGDTLSGIGGVKRPGIVHRLDKDTSGLLVVAKTEETHTGLMAQFMDHGRTGPLERHYLALVWGQFAKMTGTVNASLGRSNSNRKKRAVLADDHHEAKEAITHFTVKAEYGDDDSGQPICSLVECRLETGRTHQIRVHMSHIGHPLVGDQDYGKHFQTKVNTLPDAAQAEVDEFKRQALHAAVLGFEHPITGEHLRFEADVPDDMKKVLRVLG